MAKEDHWFKFFYKLFIISTQGWRDDEVGAYLRLLINQFDRGGLPDNEQELSKLITSFKKNWPLLKKKFKKCEDGFLRNNFMDEIRIERDEKSRTASDRGRTGGRGNKKQNESFDKAKAFKNESDILSLSSLSDSGFKEGGLGEETIFPIEHCIVVALNDERWVKSNSATKEKLESFNKILEGQGVYQKNPGDYKTHYHNWLKKNENGNQHGTFKQNNSHKPVITGEAESAGSIRNC